MIYSIQYLRGIAALLVVLHHAAHKGFQYGNSSLDWLKIGSSGVDLFFIISGFIMCYTTHNKSIDFYTFIKNRIERIIPLYWFFSVLALIIFLIAPQYVNSSGGNTGVLASFLLIPNGQKYLVNNGWTLSYEFYFYAIFSLFILFNHNKKYRYINICLTILILTIIGTQIKTNIFFLNFIFSDFLLEFALGIVAFIIFKKITINHLISTTMIVFSFIWLVYLNNNSSIFNNSLNYAIPMFLLFNGFLHLEMFFKKNNKYIPVFFERLGSSSYSLYLVHPFILSPIALILNKLNLQIYVLFPILITATSIIAGWFTYIYIEKNIEKFLRKKEH